MNLYFLWAEKMAQKMTKKKNLGGMEFKNGTVNIKAINSRFFGLFFECNEENTAAEGSEDPLW